jgi:hypothetical protein
MLFGKLAYSEEVMTRDLKPSKLEGAEYVKLNNGYQVWFS